LLLIASIKNSRSLYCLSQLKQASAATQGHFSVFLADQAVKTLENSGPKV
jgi:hypothetical protein